MNESYLNEHLSKDLYCSQSSSPQPNSLIRMALFTPSSRVNKKDVREYDITVPIRTIEYFSKEGFDTATIRGIPLNIQIDFKVWCGIVFAFSKYGLESNTIEMRFTEFADMCGYDSKRFNKRLRSQIEKSLDRIQDQKIRFRKKDSGKFVATGLLLKAYYDIEQDIIALVADEKLWELYSVDHQILVSLDILRKLPRAEVAQCLYLYFSSLPEDPLPINYERMRKRLNMNMADKEVNRQIRTAITKLEKLGYLTGLWVTFHKEKAYKITARNRKLLTSV